MSDQIDPAALVNSTEAVKPKDWSWRTQQGQMLRPCIMETRHLHHTLVMIWHHTMPANAQIRSYYRRYHFSPFYTRQYMKQAIRVMASELASRDDLLPEWRVELRKMQEYLNPTSGLVGNVRQIQEATQ